MACKNYDKMKQVLSMGARNLGLLQSSYKRLQANPAKTFMSKDDETLYLYYKKIDDEVYAYKKSSTIKMDMYQEFNKKALYGTIFSCTDLPR